LLLTLGEILHSHGMHSTIQQYEQEGEYGVEEDIMELRGWKKWETGENSEMRSLMIFIPQQILMGR
jgi:hypothetical protein